MAYDPFLTPMESAVEELPSVDVTARFVNDQHIRKCGYAIKSRPARGEPVWEKGGVEFKHSEVLRRERLGKRSVVA